MERPCQLGRYCNYTARCTGSVTCGCSFWLFLLLLLWFRRGRGLITLIRFYSVVHRSIPLVSSEHNMHLLESWHNSALDFLQRHLLNFLNSSTGSPLNGVSGLNFATLTFKALHTGHPPYLADLLQYHKPMHEVHAIICQDFTYF